MLTGERAMGATFDIQDIGWIDFETRSTTQSIKVGHYKYASEADAIICVYAIGNGPVQSIVAPDFDHPIDFADFPLDFIKHHAKVMTGTAKWAAFNAGFDKAIWNFAIAGTPLLEPEMVIDVMAQAVASGLAPDLASAAKQAGADDKVKDGRKLINLFCTPDSTATPASHPAEWRLFQDYAVGDITAMRSLFKHTRQLPLAEWREYWAMERINERGVGVDLAMVKHASKLAAEDKFRSAAEIAKITEGRVGSVDQVAKMTAWLLGVLPDEGRAILTKRDQEIDDDTGEEIRPAKHHLTRKQVTRLIALCMNQPALAKPLRVLQIRLYGGSKTPAKFAKVLLSNVDGVLYGQYVFNGAAQTGRASSKGVQIHNLARDTLPDEYEAIEALLNQCSYAELVAAGGNADPVSRKLSLLIRPAFIPLDGDLTFIWSDWSQIEARVLPWLAGDDRGARARLQVFVDVDANSHLADLYTRTAADITGCQLADITKAQRQIGKVAELALGFGGGVGALQAMAANYGIHIPEDEARMIVERWRAANQWCVAFWGWHTQDSSVGLWGAIHQALEDPGEPKRAGRILYVYDPRYLGGSLICILPSGRFLTYRSIRYERVEDLDEDDAPTGRFSTHLRFARGHGRVKFWHGMACENVVQAVAADVLRGTLVRLVHQGADVRLHTHDEVLVEANLSELEITSQRLRGVMCRGFHWSEGLPLKSEETIAPYYTKWEG